MSLSRSKNITLNTIVGNETSSTSFSKTFKSDMKSNTNRIRYLGCQQINTSMKCMDFETRSLIAKECIVRVCNTVGILLQQRSNTDYENDHRSSNIPTTTTSTSTESRITKMLSGQPILVFTGADVSLDITTNFLKLSVIESDEVIVSHKMPNISFASGGDSETSTDFVAYVAKDNKFGRSCFVLECRGGSLANEIITTIGQAFEIRFKEIFKRTPSYRLGQHHSRSSPSIRQHHELDSDRDYYNDLPGKVPPDMSLISSKSSEVVISKPQAAPRRTTCNKKDIFFVSNHNHSSSSSDPSSSSFRKESSLNLIDLTDDAENRKEIEYDEKERSKYENVVAVVREQQEIEDSTTSEEETNIRDPFDMQPFNSTLKEMSRKNKLKLFSTTTSEDNNNVRSLGLLEDQEWYHGPISRIDSELLVANDGDFLIRECQGTPGQYVLTGKERGIIRHFLLVDDDGVTVKTKDRTFKSVIHLVNFYQHNNLPLVLGNDPIYLRNPIKVPFKI